MIIYKYQLPLADSQTVAIPIGAQFLSVQMQDGCPCLWAIVDATAPKTAYTVRMLGTGHEHSPMDSQFEFVDTFQFSELVFHVFAASDALTAKEGEGADE